MYRGSHPTVRTAWGTYFWGYGSLYAMHFSYRLHKTCDWSFTKGPLPNWCIHLVQHTLLLLYRRKGHRVCLFWGWGLCTTVPSTTVEAVWIMLSKTSVLDSAGLHASWSLLPSHLLLDTPSKRVWRWWMFPDRLLQSRSPANFRNVFLSQMRLIRLKSCFIQVSAYAEAFRKKERTPAYAELRTYTWYG